MPATGREGSMEALGGVHAELRAISPNLRDGRSTAVPSPDRTKSACSSRPSPCLTAARRQPLSENQRRPAERHRPTVNPRQAAAPSRRERRGDLGAVVARAEGRRDQPGDHPRLLRRRGSNHPHLQAGTAGDWPLNVVSTSSRQRHNCRLPAARIESVGRPPQPGLPGVTTASFRHPDGTAA